VTPQIVDWGFTKLGLHRVFLTASSDNPGALKAYEKAGFVFEGRMKDAFFRTGKFSDKVIMGILRPKSSSI
jgi:RimJ/RimL family protein N-acetyltransferase